MHPTKQAAALAFAFNNALAQAITRIQRSGHDNAGPFIRRRARAGLASGMTQAEAISRACRDYWRTQQTTEQPINPQPTMMH